MGVGWLLVFAVILAAVFIAVTAIRRRREPAGAVLIPPPPGTFSIQVTRGIAMLWALLGTAGTLWAAASALFSPSVPVHLPVAAFWPEPYPSADVQYPDATVVGGSGFTFADVNVDGLDAAARVWLALGHLSIGATTVIVALAVYRVTSHLLNNEPFRSVLSAPTHLAATAVIVGGLAWQLCFGVAGSLASNQVLGSHGWGIDTEKVGAHLDPLDMPVIGWPQSGTNFTIDFWPIAAGLALFAISAAFRHSERLQRDTEGLV